MIFFIIEILGKSEYFDKEYYWIIVVVRFHLILYLNYIKFLF